MSHILFISDVHLSGDRQDIVDAFVQFCAGPCMQADALYILGDFFDAYLGFDCDAAWFKSAMHALRNLAAKRPVFIMPGNHDFLMNQEDCDRLGCQLLNDPCVIDCYGKQVLLTHGDFLCAQDQSHQRMRKIVEQRWLQKCWLRLPYSLRERVANQLSQLSQHATQKKSTAQMDICARTALSWLETHQAALLIHGHTHRPCLALKDEVKRIVLGAWPEGVAFLKADHNHGFSLYHQPWGQKISRRDAAFLGG